MTEQPISSQYWASEEPVVGELAVQDEVRAIDEAIHDMYDAYLNADRARSNRHIAPEVTLWDSEYEPLIVGLPGLEQLRDMRPSGDEVVPAAQIDVETPVIDIWGDIALARYVFTVRFAENRIPAQRVRNTSVWRKTASGWKVVHNHEDVVAQ